MKAHFSKFRATAGVLTLAMATVATGLVPSAQAAVTTSAELRVLQLETSRSDGTGFFGRDIFNNGNPLNGMDYRAKVGGSPSGPTVTGGYNASQGTFTAGAELAGPAPGPLGAVGGLGIGGLNFRAQDGALSNSNLTPAGYNAKVLSLNVNFIDPRVPNPVPGAAFQGLVQSNLGFGLFGAWDMIAPSSGASFGIRAQSAGVPGTLIFNDLIDLRVVTSLLGDTTVNLERISRDAAGTFFRQVLGSVPFSAAYSGSLADVELVSLDLTRATPLVVGTNTPLHASFRLLDISAGGAISSLGQFDFAIEPQIFTDGGAIMFASARASWLESTAPASDVPEPSSLALLAVGLLVAAGMARRRQSRG